MICGCEEQQDGYSRKAIDAGRRIIDNKREQSKYYL
jgi:hypothetical protein